MSQLFSKQCEYALQAVTYLALHEEMGRVSIKDLSARLKISPSFLAKILQDLARKGLLASHRGPSGGFALARPAREISLFSIVEVIDGVGFTRDCVMGFPECSGEHPCAVHDNWGRLREEIQTMLAGKNIAHMAAEMKKPEYDER
jgi:Rrf2 family iron-sulfur cluster assembly transcriptional regulator